MPPSGHQVRIIWAGWSALVFLQIVISENYSLIHPESMLRIWRDQFWIDGCFVKILGQFVTVAQQIDAVISLPPFSFLLYIQGVL
jgi:hypothetical protein